MKGAPLLHLRTIKAPGDYPGSVVTYSRVELERGGRFHAAFDAFLNGGDELDDFGVLPYVTKVGRRLVVSMWVPDLATLFASLHDAGTGRRVGEAVAVEAYPMDEPECGNVLTDTRVMPVIDGDELRVALLWGFGGHALLFDRPGEEGRHVRVDVTLPESEEDLGGPDVHAEDAPAVLRLDRCGVAPCLRAP